MSKYNVSYHSGQKFSKLRQRCIDTRTTYKDTDFPANNKSIFYSKHDKDIKWMRPKEFVKSPRLVRQDMEFRYDIVEGELMYTWLMTAFSILAKQPKLMNVVIPDFDSQEWREDIQHYGIFRFHFWRLGKWNEIVIDDLLPTKDGKLIFCHSKQPDQFWPALLEKAYAKFNGDYESLLLCQLTDVLADFTGGVPETIDLVSYRTRSQREVDTLHDNIRRWLEQSAVCVVYAQSTDENRELTAQYGIVAESRGYVIAEVDSTRPLRGPDHPHFLVHLHNPYRVDEWRGPWSQSSDIWEIVSEEENWRLRNGPRDSGHGYFWVDIFDLVQVFSALDVQHAINPSNHAVFKNWNEAIFNGTWSGEGAARNGGGEDSITCLDNPQYRFDVKKYPVDTVMMTLDQDLGVDRVVGEELPEIGLIVISVEDNRQYRIHRRTMPVRDMKVTSTYRKGRNVFLKVLLNAGRYVILPVYRDSGKNGQFALRLYTAMAANAHELDQDHPVQKWCCGRSYKIVTYIKIECIKELDPIYTALQHDISVYVWCESDVYTSAYVKARDVTNFNVTLIFYRQQPKLMPVNIAVYSRGSTSVTGAHGVIKSAHIGSAEIMETGCEDVPSSLEFDVIQKSNKDGSILKKKIGRVVVQLQSDADLDAF